jgi:hypothetical protein
MRVPLSDLPFWPRLLSREEAARYVGVSTDVFDEEVRAGVWPAAMRRGVRNGRLTWDRNVLDLAADRASGLSAQREAGPAATGPAISDEDAALALERYNAPTSRNRSKPQHQKAR